MATPISGSLGAVINILNLVNGLGPIAVGLVMRLLQKLQGVPDDELLTQADTTWDEVIADAKRELGR